ncbi:hypothetical protein MPL1032_270097 [Mesorhizobium plurifarium]|uniref:Uncharacterized protein n=1 Tax=Mesorhizobium plurifarium TaxID=69974 RepID=A0A090GDQ3_MESPL|nr:hypothetical protein MPL3365_30040 [Mesorhizobium plurifarium]CDX59739.1 hypothetical protein MPL1032_270097 [Mesorhizobium plurifarium]
MTASLRPLPAENFGTVRAGIFTSAPVCGLRPVEAARFDTVKFPKPTSRTSPPFFSSPVITENTASTADCASAFEMLAASATADTSSFLFIKIPFHEKTGTYDSSGRKRTLERSDPEPKPKTAEFRAFLNFFVAFSHEKAGLEARLSHCALQL